MNDVCNVVRQAVELFRDVHPVMLELVQMKGYVPHFAWLHRVVPGVFVVGWRSLVRTSMYRTFASRLYAINGGWLKIFATFHENGEQACTCKVNGASKSYFFLRDRYTECCVKLLLSRRTFCVHHTTMHRLTTSFYLKPQTWGTVCVEPAMLQPNDAVSRTPRWRKTHSKSPHTHTKHTT